MTLIIIVGNVCLEEQFCINHKQEKRVRSKKCIVVVQIALDDGDAELRREDHLAKLEQHTHPMGLNGRF